MQEGGFTHLAPLSSLAVKARPPRLCSGTHGPTHGSPKNSSSEFEGHLGVAVLLSGRTGAWVLEGPKSSSQEEPGISNLCCVQGCPVAGGSALRCHLDNLTKNAMQPELWTARTATVTLLGLFQTELVVCGG